MQAAGEPAPSTLDGEQGGPHSLCGAGMTLPEGVREQEKVEWLNTVSAFEWRARGAQHGRRRRSDSVENDEAGVPQRKVASVGFGHAARSDRFRARSGERFLGRNPDWGSVAWGARQFWQVKPPTIGVGLMPPEGLEPSTH